MKPDERADFLPYQPVPREGYLPVGNAGLFLPIEFAAHIAQVTPGACLIALKDTGHFSYLESPEVVCSEITKFIRGKP